MKTTFFASYFSFTVLISSVAIARTIAQVAHWHHRRTLCANNATLAVSVPATTAVPTTAAAQETFPGIYLADFSDRYKVRCSGFFK